MPQFVIEREVPGIHELSEAEIREISLKSIGVLDAMGPQIRWQGDPDSARQYYQRSLAGYRQIDDHWGIAGVLTDVANIDLQAADYAAANGSLKQALQACRKLGHQRGVARQLESLSWCSGCLSRDAEAVALASAAAAIRQKVGMPPKRAEREKIDQTLALARTRLSADAFANAWREGRTLPRSIGSWGSPLTSDGSDVRLKADATRRRGRIREAWR